MKRIIFALFFSLPSALFAIQTVERFKPIEIPVPHIQTEPGVKNVWQDLPIVGTFTDPDGRKITVNGFYHSKDLFMIRFAPDVIGVWKYSIVIEDPILPAKIISDSFQCAASNEQGFIRLHPNNPKRWIYSGTGNLYTAVGFGDCMDAKRDSILSDADLLDGGYRPKGFHTGIEWILPYSQYLISYGDAAGFNIYRYSDGNCAYSIVKTISHSGNDYDTLHSRWTDTLFSALRAHGFRIFMTILATPQGNSSDDNSMAAMFRYAQYCIDRYGSLVDFWELANESNPDSLWISKVAGYFHAHDPYHHLVSMSNQTPNHPAIDIISPHWYGKEDVKGSDVATASQINYEYEQYKKPVIFGEQGDGGWDSLSAMRLRGRIWSALFNEGIIVFWNSTFAKDCPCNQYLGWEERRYARVLQNFAVLLDTGVHRSPLKQAGDLNIWGLQSQAELALYIRNDQDVNVLNSGKKISITSPIYGGGYWYDVHSGDILGQADLVLGQQTLQVPAFQTDIAFLARNAPVSRPVTDSLFRIDVNPRTEVLLNTPLQTPLIFSVKITNIGKKPITIEKAWTSSPSRILSLSALRSFPYTLQPSESIDVPIQYIMSDTGGTAAMFSFQHDASPSWENIAISATGILKSGVSENPVIDDRIKVFPDPANNIVNLRWDEYAKITKFTIQLFNLEGLKILEQTSEENNAVLDVSKLSNGTYQMVISEQGLVVASKKISIVH